MSDIPTLDEAGVRGYEMSIRDGMAVSMATKAIVKRLHETIVQSQAQQRYAKSAPRSVTTRPKNSRR